MAGGGLRISGGASSDSDVNFGALSYLDPPQGSFALWFYVHSWDSATHVTLAQYTDASGVSTEYFWRAATGFDFRYRWTVATYCGFSFSQGMAVGKWIFVAGSYDVNRSAASQRAIVGGLRNAPVEPTYTQQNQGSGTHAPSGPFRFGHPTNGYNDFTIAMFRRSNLYLPLDQLARLWKDPEAPMPGEVFCVPFDRIAIRGARVQETRRGLVGVVSGANIKPGDAPPIPALTYRRPVVKLRSASTRRRQRIAPMPTEIVW